MISLKAISSSGERRLVFSNPASKKSRSAMTVRVSDDAGRNWRTLKQVYDGSAAYSCLAELPDGRVGLLYEKDNFASIVFVAIDVK